MYMCWEMGIEMVVPERLGMRDWEKYPRNVAISGLCVTTWGATPLYYTAWSPHIIGVTNPQITCYDSSWTPGKTKKGNFAQFREVLVRAGRRVICLFRRISWQLADSGEREQRASVSIRWGEGEAIMETFARVYDIYAPHLYSHHLSMIQNDFPRVQARCEWRAADSCSLDSAPGDGLS